MLLHASECWVLQKEEVQRLLLNKHYSRYVGSKLRIKWVFPYSCTFRIKAEVKSLGCIDTCDRCTNHCTHLEVDGYKGKEWPCKTLHVTVTEYGHLLNIDASNTHDEPMWERALMTAIKNSICISSGQDGKVIK